jgi:hypothetical protein
MKSILFKTLLVLSILTGKVIAQPFVDIVGFNYQTFSDKYKIPDDSINTLKNKTDNYALNFFLPKEFKNGNTLLIRLNTESINSTISPDTSYSNRLSAISLPIGMKLVTKNKKWETILIAIPKIASDFKDAIDGYDFQMGGIFLQHWVPNNKIKIKAGLYYNREAFGNFYVPLVGIDWKINNRIYMYGILPTSYKVEFNIIKNRLYTGLNLKYFTRSFRLSKDHNYDYVRYDEAQVKLFLDCFVAPKVLVFAEAGYSFGKNPWQYKYNTKDVAYKNNPLYGPMGNYMVFNFGLAYRIRFDLEKKEPTN